MNKLTERVEIQKAIGSELQKSLSKFENTLNDFS